MGQGSDEPHVVIVGAGFAGLACAKALGNTPVRVTVIDRANYHLFVPLLYQVATAALSPADIARPIRRILGRYRNINVVLGDVTGIDTKARTVRTNAGQVFTYDRLVVATGSSPVVPDVVAGVEHWTNVDATSTHEVPESLAVLGSGPVGCELAQFFSRMGSRVTLVERGGRILARVHEDAAAVLASVFEEEGIDVRTGVEAQRAEQGALHLSDGSHLEAERLLVAAGRRPNVDGLEEAGVRIGRRGVEVDEQCRAAGNVWAIGDVTGVAQFTHVGKYQARVAAAAMCGQDVRADYRAIPAGIFTDPEVGTVGRTEGVSARYELSATPRTATYEKPKRDGFVRLFADPAERVLTGAVCVGPQAAEWLGQLTLAVRSATPVDVLVDVIQPYPTFSEAIFFALQELVESL
jgi:pyruvate/2-oxoglutarate dehydrogenase complex dihydrolipoamide dehydrogenase (E3) component